MNKNNVISINRKKDENFSGFSAYSTRERSSFEEMFLSIGSFASMAALQIICIAAFTFPQSILFAAIAVIGISAGLAVYKFFPARIKSYFNLQKAPLNTSTEDINILKAA